MSWPARAAQRPVLAPPGHPSVDELRVAGEALVGTEAEPLGDPGAEALDEGVGARDQLEGEVDAGRRLEVDADRAPTPVEHVGVGARRALAAHGVDPVEADDVGTEVREHQPAERPGPDAGQLDDPAAAKRAGGHGRTL